MSQYNPQTSTIDFTNSALLTFNSSDVDIASGTCQLKLKDDPGQSFPVSFDNDTGFIYDSDLIEFTGGVARQIDKRPTDATFYNNFDDTDIKTNPENSNWGDGSSTGTLVGGASIVLGALNLSGSSNCDWSNDNISTLIQTGCIRIRFRPKYSGSAPAVQTLFWANNNTQNRILMRLNGSLCQCYVNDNSASVMCNISFSFSATAEQIYELELNFDADNGNHRVFLDGVLEDNDTGTATRGACNDFVRCGGDSSGHNIDILDILIFDAVQHTTGYTPDWSNIHDYNYLETSVTTPELEYTGVGTLISFDMFTTTESDNLRYTIQVGRSGDYLYWDGADWVVSDGTYAQATNAITFNNNSSSIPVNGEIYGQFKIHYPNSNITQGSIENLEAILTAQLYSTSGPPVEIVENYWSDKLISVSVVTNTPTGTSIKAVIKLGTTWYYLVNGVLTESDGTETQSSEFSDFNTYIQDFITERTRVRWRFFLITTDDTITPQITNFEFVYAFAGSTSDSIDICTVYWVSLNADNTVPENIQFYAVPSAKKIKYKTQTIICDKNVADLPDSEDGYTELNLIENENMTVINSDTSVYYKIFKKHNGKAVQIANISVPNQNSAILLDILKED